MPHKGNEAMKKQKHKYTHNKTYELRKRIIGKFVALHRTAWAQLDMWQ